MVDGIHDMGGMHGFGGIVREENEPVFHAEWEKRAFGVALQAADGVGFGDDHLRASIERIPADVYLRSGYYELWIHSIQEVMERRGVLTKAEIETRMAALAEPGRAAGGSGVTLDEVDAAMAAGASTKRPEAKAEPRFAVGDPVLVGNDHPAHHTRSPRYCRGRRGKVIADHGVFVFPDTNSRDLGENPEHCYTVRFAAEDVWGASARAGDTLCVDLWESYLEPA